MSKNVDESELMNRLADPMQSRKAFEHVVKKADTGIHLGKTDAV